MPQASIHINYRRPRGYPALVGIEAIRYFKNMLEGVVAGTVESDMVNLRYNDSITPLADGYVGGQAAGLIVAATGTGTVGATIGGTAITVTWATSDILTQTALAAAIRASAVTSLFCTATSKLMSLTCASVLTGTTVNICNTTFTALANGVTPAVDGEFTVGGSDTACALSLVKAINHHPSTAGRIRAVSVAGVVYIGLVDNRTALPTDAIRYASASTISIGVAVPTASARVMVIATTPGMIGNFVTVVASGTNYTYSTNGTAGQLGQGSGGPQLTGSVDVVP